MGRIYRRRAARAGRFRTPRRLPTGVPGGFRAGLAGHPAPEARIDAAVAARPPLPVLRCVRAWLFCDEDVGVFRAGTTEVIAGSSQHRLRCDDPAMLETLHAILAEAPPDDAAADDDDEADQRRSR
jgi:hypothetical protein